MSGLFNNAANYNHVANYVAEAFQPRRRRATVRMANDADKRCNRQKLQDESCSVSYPEGLR